MIKQNNFQSADLFSVTDLSRKRLQEQQKTRNLLNFESTTQAQEASKQNTFNRRFRTAR